MGPESAEGLVVVDVAVSMRRQVPVLPGGASDQSTDKVVVPESLGVVLPGDSASGLPISS